MLTRFLFQIFHGVWTIAFFCLTIINTKTVLPNASCLLAGYLPATTVLHILLIPSDYPLPVSLFQTEQSDTVSQLSVSYFRMAAMNCPSPATIQANCLN